MLSEFDVYFILICLFLSLRISAGYRFGVESLLHGSVQINEWHLEEQSPGDAEKGSNGKYTYCFLQYDKLVEHNLRPCRFSVYCNHGHVQQVDTVAESRRQLPMLEAQQPLNWSPEIDGAGVDDPGQTASPEETVCGVEGSCNHAIIGKMSHQHHWRKHGSNDGCQRQKPHDDHSALIQSKAEIKS